MIKKNPNVIFALYDPNNKKSHVTIEKKWFEIETQYFLKRDNFRFFKFDRRGDHGSNCTDGFAILNILLKSGFKNLNILGFTAFGSNEDDSNFSTYTTSHDERVINRNYFTIRTSEDQRADRHTQSMDKN